MSKQFCILIIILIKITYCSAETWQLPNDKKLYNETSYLTAHNAFSNQEEGWMIYPQQKWSIKNQLDHGVRGFMLDIWDYNDTILLCHGGCKPLTVLVTKGIGSPKPFKNALLTIQEWLKQNPSEIITLFLENRVDNDKLKKELLSLGDFAKMILTKQDWNPEKHDNKWPTLEWMHRNNKRIVIFNEDKSKSRRTNDNDPFFFVWDYVIESQYGTTDIKKACIQRADSQKQSAKKRTLYLQNFFSSSSGSKTNAYANLKKLLACSITGVEPGKKPNFLALDFLDKGDGLKVVNELNKL